MGEEMRAAERQQQWWWVPQGAIPGALGRQAWASLGAAGEVLVVLADPCDRAEQWVGEIAEAGAHVTVVRGCEAPHAQQVNAWHRACDGGDAAGVPVENMEEAIGGDGENTPGRPRTVRSPGENSANTTACQNAPHSVNETPAGTSEEHPTPHAPPRADGQREVLCVGPLPVCEALWQAALGSDGAGIDSGLRCAVPSTRGLAVVDFVDVMDRMMGPQGCPWVPQQTHRSLAPFVLEEVYELLEAIDAENHTELLEELGDVLFQVVFHASVAEQRPDGFAIDEVAEGIAAKMRRRRPHVFGTKQQRSNHLVATNVEATGEQWDAVKKAEKQRDSCLDGIAVALPALARAEKVTDRAARAGLLEHVHPVTWAGGDEGDDPVATVGDELLVHVMALWEAGEDAETCLREAVRRAEARVRAAERDDT